MSAPSNATAVNDGLSNVISGVGTEADKRSFDAFTFGPVSQQEVDSAYRSSWLARKIHDLPPLDMVRAWRDWQADKDAITALEAVEKAVALQAKVRRALVLARLYGGSALVLGVAQGDLQDPLDVRKVGKGALKFVHTFSRHQITTGDIETDLLSPYFGEPEWYEVQGKSSPVRIHPSRVIPFIGQPIPDGMLGVASANGPWGDPLLQSVRDALLNSELAQGGFASLIHEAKIDTMKIPGLSANMAAADYEARLTKRLQVANRAKSLLNTRILDGEEEWETRQIAWDGMPAVMEAYLDIVCAAADMTVSRLRGTSAKGLNATGEGDNDNYDESIQAKQELDLRPSLERLDEVLIRSALGSRPDDIHFKFADLDKADPKEEAELQDKRAETATKLVNSGLVPLVVMAKAVQNGLIEDGAYPGLETALTDTAATVGLPTETFKSLLTAWQAGAAPRSVLFERLKAAGLLPKDMDLEGFEAALEEEGGALGEAADPAVQSDPTKTAESAPVIPFSRAANDAAPRTLYVSRRVLNAADLIDWAKGQGFATTLPADQLHVTIAFSRAPIDWMEVGETWGSDKEGRLTIPPGGARLVEPLGPKGAVVLLFNSWELAYRHGQIREAGASWDHPEYQPHVTITYEPGDVDLTEVEPYRGQIVLGPEIFEEVVEDWEKTVTEDGGQPGGTDPF